MKKKLFTLTLVCFYFVAFSQKPLWTSHFTGTGDNNPITSAIDENDNIYIVGDFTLSINQAPNQGLSKTLTKKGVLATDRDVFISKYDKDGKLIWLRQVGGTGSDITAYITYDKKNKVVWATLNTKSDKCYDENNVLISNASTGGQYSILLLSLDANTGEFLIKKDIGTDAFSHRVNGLKVDSANRVVITGYFSSVLHFTATDSLKTSASYNNFIARFDNQGNFLKAKLIDGSSSAIYGLAVRDKEHLVMSGYFSSKLKIDSDSITNVGDIDIFLCALDTNLNYIKNSFRKIGGPGLDQSLSISCDKYNNTYVSGYFASDYLNLDSTANIIISRGNASNKINKGSSGTNDFLFAKYDSLYNLKWFNYGGTAGDDRMSRIFANENSVMVAGRFGTPSLNFKNDTEINNGVSGTDGLTIVVNKNNNLVHLIGLGSDGNADVIETGVITSVGDFIVVSRFNSPTLTIGSDVLTNPNADKDMVIVKYAKANLSITKNQIICPGSNDGSIAVMPEGSTLTPYTFKWTKKGDASFTSSEQYLSGLGAGTYYVTFKDAKGFTLTDSAVLDPTGINQITPSMVPTDASCNGGNNGKITITVSGGYNGPHTFNWVANSGSGLVPTDSNQTTLSKGNYKVTVTDIKGCKGTNSITINEPLAITIDTIVTHVTAIGKNDGAIDINPKNGTGSYTFAWTKVDSSYTSAIEDITGLYKGQFNILVTDSTGCTATKSIPVRDPGELIVSLSASQITCKGANNGQVVASVSNAPGVVSYSWTKNGVDMVINNDSILNLTPGTYKVVASYLTYTGSNQVTITEPTVFAITGVNVKNVDCYGTATGSIDVILSGGTLPYTYAWAKVGESSYAPTSANLMDLISGTFTYIATDKNGCTVDTFAIITQNDSMTISSSVQPVSCYGETYDGAVNQTVSGGNGSFTFLWSYNSLDSEDILGIKPGSYYCTITDVKGCRNTKRYIIDEPGTLNGSFILKDITCFGKNDGSIEIKVTGGNSPYKYAWKAPINDTVSKILGAGKGLYSVIVKDSKKCESDFKMTTSIQEPTPLVLAIDSTADELNGTDGKISASATGGIVPYNFLLIPLGTSNADGQFTTLGPNKYMIYLTDKNMCGPVKSDSITILPKKIIDTIPTINLKINTNRSATIYPNPNNGIFSVITSGDVMGAFNISLLNESGTVVLKQVFYSKDSINEFNMNVSYLTKGIYFLKINTDEAIKVIIQ